MIINDSNLISRIRLLLSHLAFVSPAPFKNVPGSPTNFVSEHLMVGYNGLGQVTIVANPDYVAATRTQLDDRGWVNSFDGQNTFVVSVHRMIRQPVAQPSIASGNPL
jgi:hypothetical protein